MSPGLTYDHGGDLWIRLCTCLLLKIFIVLLHLLKKPLININVWGKSREGLSYFTQEKIRTGMNKKFCSETDVCKNTFSSKNEVRVRMGKILYSESHFKHPVLYPRHQVLNHVGLTLQDTSVPDTVYNKMVPVTFPAQKGPWNYCGFLSYFRLTWVKMLSQPRKYLHTSLSEALREKKLHNWFIFYICYLARIWKCRKVLFYLVFIDNCGSQLSKTFYYKILHKNALLLTFLD